MKFLVDEDLPRSLAPALRAAGFQAEDVRDIGLRATPDAQIFRHAVDAGMTLLSEDMGFANLLAFPTGSHAGVVVARFPSQVPTSTLNAAIVAALAMLSEDELRGGLVIIEPGRVRLRRHPSSSE